MTGQVRISYINFWAESDPYFSRFLRHHFEEVVEVAAETEPDILFCSVFGPIQNAVNTKAKVKIFFYGENLHRFPKYSDLNLLKDVFDLIVGSRNTNLEQKELRFPLWLISYPFYEYNQDGQNLLQEIRIARKANLTRQKEFFATCVARHDVGGVRSKICDALAAMGPIQYPSSFRRNTAAIGARRSDKIEYISRALFSVCPENSFYEGYCSEKLLEALEGGTMPIYWGAPNPERELLNQEAFCFVNPEDAPQMQTRLRDYVKNWEGYAQLDPFTEQAPYVLSDYYSTLSKVLRKSLRNETDYKVNAISYASECYTPRAEVITKEASTSGYFDSFYCFGEGDIPVLFKQRHQSIWNNSKSGGGYWIWKPYIINEALKQMSDDEVLVYYDAGCSLCTTEPAKKRFQNYIELVRNHWTGLLRFELTHKECDLTNQRTIDFFQQETSKDIRALSESNMLMATALVLRKTAFSIAFFARCLEILERDELLFTDAYSQAGEWHRHDQSIMSMLYKIMGGSLILPDETYFVDGFENNPLASQFPIWATRSYAVG